MQIDILTPHGNVYSAEIDEVTVPGEMGELGILPGHIPVIAALSVGELVVRRGSQVESFAIEGGFLELARDRVGIITERALRPGDIDVERIQAERDRALVAAKEAETSGLAAVAAANHALRRADILEEIARRHGKS